LSDYERRRDRPDLTDRHPGTRQVMQWFESAHLTEPQQTIALYASHLADAMVRELTDGPELTAGLRKLLEAKDCFVRASLVAGGG
jgi:hypothetical protein